MDMMSLNISTSFNNSIGDIVLRYEKCIYSSHIHRGSWGNIGAHRVS